jgi:CubicO group peptidase (beta-lactamase class C family)
MRVNPVQLDVAVDPTGSVAAALERALQNGEVALQVSAFIDGVCGADVAGGFADVSIATAATGSSLFPVFSATKGVAAAAALRCVADGVIALDAPLVEIWPELVRRLVVAPAEAGSFWIGLPDAEQDRVVTLYPGDSEPVRPSTLQARVLPTELSPGQIVFGRPDVRRATMLGAGGIGNARSLAKIYDHLAGAIQVGHAWGDILAFAASVHRNEVDLVLGTEVARGLGFRVSSPANAVQAFPFDASSTTFGHAGAGGSVAWADTSLNAGFAITRSRMTARGYGDPVVTRLARALYDAVLASA